VNANTVPTTPISLPVFKRAILGHALADAIVEPVAYADIFDYPLTAPEIHRYLIDRSVSRETVQAALEHDPTLAQRLSRTDDYFALTGRESIVGIRRQRAELAERFWLRARRLRADDLKPAVRQDGRGDGRTRDGQRAREIRYRLLHRHRTPTALALSPVRTRHRARGR